MNTVGRKVEKQFIRFTLAPRSANDDVQENTMTRLLIISITLLLPLGLTFSQEKPQAPDESRQEIERPEAEEPEAEENNDNASPLFIDEDGDGINDRTQTHRRDGSGEGRQLRNRGSDDFIDNDGDGINDRRCSGMGISGESRGHRGGKK